VTKEEVYEFVEEAVDERPLRVHFFDNKRSSRFALVAFSGFDLLAQCISKLNGKELGGAEVRVGLNRVVFDFGIKSKRVRMSNLPRKVTEQNIADHLRKYSKISSPPISITLRDQPLDDGKMDAVIDMKSHEDAMKSVQNVTMTKMKGTTCFVDLMRDSRHEALRGRTANFHLYRLHDKADHLEVKELCKEYGAVKSVWVRKGLYGGSAKVRMESKEAASRAFDGLHGKKVEGKVLNTAFVSRPSHRRVPGQKTMRLGNSAAKKKWAKGAFSGGSKMKGSKAHLNRAIKGKGKKKGGFKK